jgi:hypothetical protein
MVELPPGEKPRFMQPATPQDEEYPGIVELPTFDAEVAPLTAPPKPEPEPEIPVPTGPLEVQPRVIKQGIVKERWRAVARAYATGRFSIPKLAAKFNYTPQTVNSILRSPWVQEEIARFRDAYTTELTSRIKEASIDAIDYLHETILDTEMKPDIRSANSRWMIEQQKGKAHQSVTHQHTDLNAFWDMLRSAQERGEPVDVTPQAALPAPTAESAPDAVPTNQWDAWLDENLG